MREPANWQQQAAAFARMHDLLRDPVTLVLGAVSDAGEVARKVLRATDYRRQSPRPSPELAAELGRTLYGLPALAEVYGVEPKRQCGKRWRSRKSG